MRKGKRGFRMRQYFEILEIEEDDFAFDDFDLDCDLGIDFDDFTDEERAARHQRWAEAEEED